MWAVSSGFSWAANRSVVVFISQVVSRGVSRSGEWEIDTCRGRRRWTGSWYQSLIFNQGVSAVVAGRKNYPSFLQWMTLCFLWQNRGYLSNMYCYHKCKCLTHKKNRDFSLVPSSLVFQPSAEYTPTPSLWAQFTTGAFKHARNHTRGDYPFWIVHTFSFQEYNTAFSWDYSGTTNRMKSPNAFVNWPGNVILLFTCAQGALRSMHLREAQGLSTNYHTWGKQLESICNSCPGEKLL